MGVKAGWTTVSESKEATFMECRKCRLVSIIDEEGERERGEGQV